MNYVVKKNSQTLCVVNKSQTRSKEGTRSICHGNTCLLELNHHGNYGKHQRLLRFIPWHKKNQPVGKQESCGILQTDKSDKWDIPWYQTTRKRFITSIYTTWRILIKLLFQKKQKQKRPNKQKTISILPLVCCNGVSIRWCPRLTFYSLTLLPWCSP